MYVSLSVCLFACLAIYLCLTSNPSSVLLPPCGRSILPRIGCVQGEVPPEGKERWMSVIRSWGKGVQKTSNKSGVLQVREAVAGDVSLSDVRSAAGSIDPCFCSRFFCLCIFPPTPERTM